MPRSAIRRSKRSKPMAVRADNIALGDFGQDPLRSGATDHSRDGVLLLARITVVKVHRTCVEGPPTVGAGDVAKSIQQLSLATPQSAPLG
jgi:hypothetical protein